MTTKPSISRIVLGAPAYMTGWLLGRLLQRMLSITAVGSVRKSGKGWTP